MLSIMSSLTLRLGLILTLCLKAYDQGLSAQTIGSTTSNQEAPSEMKAHTLTPSIASGDVDLFSGTYSLSVPLGEVSTPAGLSFALSMNYSPSASGTASPTVQDGIPYGQGWNLNIPSISVETAYHSTLSPAQELGIQQQIESNSNTATYYPAAWNNHNGFWYAVQVNIPGVVSGRAVFKEFRSDGAVFVLHQFDRYIELLYTGGTWEARMPDGTQYLFGVAHNTLQMPSNERNILYKDINPWTRETIDNTTTGTTMGVRIKIQASAIPKVHTLRWYCTSIVNPVLNKQEVIYLNYKGYGKFNMYQELQMEGAFMYFWKALVVNGSDVAGFFNGGLTNPYPEANTYQEILLQDVSAFSILGKHEEIQLTYKEIMEPGPSMIAQGEHIDPLFVKEVVYAKGTPAEWPSNEPTTELDNWKRYLHGAHDRVQDLAVIPAACAVNSGNPYLVDVNEAKQYIRENAADINGLPFDHGFLESPIIRANDIPPGDLWEVKTTLASSSSSFFDINVAIGYSLTPTTSGSSLDFINENVFSSTRKSVFNTFDRMIKWNVLTDGNSVQCHTSNVFSMPMMDSDDVDISNAMPGIVIQIGPGNADINYDMSEDLDYLSTGDGTTAPSAFNAYYHELSEQHGLNGPGELGIGDRSLNIHMLSHDKMSPSFGIGLPWSPLQQILQHAGAAFEPVYLGGGNGTEPARASGYRKWWSNDSGNMPWPNDPTFLSAQSAVKRVELIRYGKVPMMLETVKRSVRSGTMSTSSVTPDGLELVSHLEFSYEMDSKRMLRNTTQMVGASADYSNHYRTTYTLTKIRQHQTRTGGPTEEIYPDEQDAVTTFSYTSPLDFVDPAAHTVPCSGTPGDVTTVPHPRENILRMGLFMERIVDPLGRVTTIEYNDPISLEMNHLTIQDKSGDGLVLPAVIGTLGCGDEYRVSAFSGTLQPTVKEITRSDELGESNRVWSYEYDEKRTRARSKVDLDDHYRTARTPALDHGFGKVTVLEPALATGERVRKEYEFHTYGEEQVVTLWDYNGTVITEVAPTIANIAPVSPEEQTQYLLWGKLARVATFDPGGSLLEENTSEYATSRAFIPAHLRPDLGRQLHDPLAFDYLCFENDFDLQAGPNSELYILGTLASNGYDLPAFLEYPPTNDFPEFYLSSYFVRKVKDEHIIHDPNGCFSNGLGGIGPVPTTDKYINPTPEKVNENVDANAQALIASLVANGLSFTVAEDLVLYSPLQEDVIQKAITVATPATAERLRTVLEAQPFLSDTSVAKVIHHADSLPPELIVALINQQGQLSDPALFAVTNSLSLRDEDKMAILQAQQRLPHHLLMKLAGDHVPLSAKLRAGLLQAEPALHHEVLYVLIASDSMPDVLKATVLATCPVLEDAVFTASNSALVNWSGDALEELTTHYPRSIPPSFLAALLARSQALPKGTLRNILFSAKTQLTQGILATALGLDVLTLEEADLLETAIGTGPLTACDAPCTPAPMAQTNITE